mgnify:CR=1 FL=1
MEALKIISVCDDRSRAFNLERSLQKQGYDYEIIQAPWRGFGTKLNQTYDYLMQNENIERFIFLDGYDTFAMGKPSELNIVGDSLISTEINCWPDVERASEYPETKSQFKHANSGSYYMKSELFKSLMQNTNVGNSDDDQRIMTDWVLTRNLQLDYEQDVFMSLCGITLNKDYEVNGNRLLTKQFTMPTFVHGNGKANMEHIYIL